MYYPTDPIENLKGVGEWLGKRLRKNEIKTIGDILNYFPFRHEDLSKVRPIIEVSENEKVVLKGEFENITTFLTKTKKRMIKAKFFDETGDLDITWFNSPFILKQIKEGDIYMLTGKVTKFGSKLNIVNPQIETSQKTSVSVGRIVPVYFNINGVYPKKLKKIIYDALENTKIEDFLDFKNLKENQVSNYLNLKEAFKEIHFPTSLENVEKAKDRIALNELIHVKLHAVKQKSIVKEQKTNFAIKNDYSANFIKNLPFKLTKDQQTATLEVNKQLSQNMPMNILLSGDVGSGKTIVSIISAYNVIKNKGKVVYLAPTVVLANQVYEEYKNRLKNQKVKCDIQLITSQTSNKKTRELEGLLNKSKNKSPDILIGTHALLNIKGLSSYANFVVIDEQHKFGVKQRAKLIENENPPHVLTMTATPIPRSLALAFFDELDVIQIKTKPKGRKKIITKVLNESQRNKCYKWLKNEVIDKNKVFHVVPFINKSKVQTFEEIKSIEEMEPQLYKSFSKKDVQVLHGKMKDDEKDKIITEFRNKKGGILLTTQVIEVGVDIKEATVIIIESAERFGLASLHQLRGRVGRNDLKSYCFLFASSNNKTNNKRLKHLEKENNGFRLASLDLQDRGSGEIFGLRQSGEIDLKFVDFRNKQILLDATKYAEEIYNNKQKIKEYNDNYFTREFFYIKDN